MDKGQRALAKLLRDKSLTVKVREQLVHAGQTAHRPEVLAFGDKGRANQEAFARLVFAFNAG